MVAPTARRNDRPQRVDHAGMGVLPLDECLFLLRGSSVGRLAFVDAQGVVILPVNHHVDGFDIYFRTAPGSKLDAARRASSAAYEVDGHDELLRGGWSVVAVGTVTEVSDIERIHLERASLQPWADNVERDHWVVLRPTRITGRRIRRDVQPTPVAAPQAHRSHVLHTGDDAQMVCSCGWRSRPVPADDPTEWDKAREEYREHVEMAGAERHVG